MKNIFLAVILVFLHTVITSQDVLLFNSSFEGDTIRGTLNPFGHSELVSGWEDCGKYRFPRETPPDIHPNKYWENIMPPAFGDTYMGMVVRDNDTWESAYQQLDEYLEKGKCYTFSIYLACSKNYWSGSRLKYAKGDDTQVNYVDPAVLRIWGGTGQCDKSQLLAESSAVQVGFWRKYEFLIEPNTNFRFITLEAFYKTPVLFPYNGHILLDEASDFILTPCDEEETLLAVNEPEETIPTAKKIDIAEPIEDQTEDIVFEEPKNYVKPKIAPPITVKPNAVPEDVKIVKETEPEIVETKPEEVAVEETILFEDIERENIKEGQVIRINKLFFEANTSNISENSFDVLDEIYTFLNNNEDIFIEVGGHTNGIPPHNYCDQLSLKRAKAVNDYLSEKGIDQDRVSYKGYGKRKPVASNQSKTGRQKNQRVEIKILSIG